MGRLSSTLLTMRGPAHSGTYRLNHPDCPAGADMKRRLYITRKDDGTILGYCHNCGDSGVASSGGMGYSRGDSIVCPSDKVETIAMPANLEAQPRDWPTEAQQWLFKANVSWRVAVQHSLAFDINTRRVVIPKFNQENELVMYQTRNVGLDDGCKYTTVKKMDSEIHTPVYASVDTGVVVICEDMMSAIRIVECDIADAIPLFSSNVDIKKVLTNVENYDIIIVWLDNDGVEVERHRDKLVKELSMVHVNVMSIDNYRDPKHYRDDDLIEVIDEAKEKYL